MLFLVLIIAGAFKATSVQTLVPFLLCVLLRSAYLQRSFLALAGIPTIFAFFFFIANWWNYHTRENIVLTADSWTTHPAVIFSLKMIVGSAALLHFVQGALEYRAQRLPSLGFGLYYGLRAFSMLKARFWDYFYAYRELRATTNRLRAELHCVSAFVTGFFLEAVLLAKGVVTMVDARGGIPNSCEWQESVPTSRYLWFLPYRLVGDMFLLLLLAIGVRYGADFAKIVTSR